MKKITDNKCFWKTIKRNFTEKNSRMKKYILAEDNVIRAETDLV